MDEPTVGITAIRERAERRRFALLLPDASVVTTGGLPEIRLSRVFLVSMQRSMGPEAWRSYLAGEDEVRIAP
jgi:hypothetical protein